MAFFCYCLDFPAVSVVTGRDFPAVSVLSGRDRKAFLAWEKTLWAAEKCPGIDSRIVYPWYCNFLTKSLNRKAFFTVQGSVSMRLLLVFINIFCSAINSLGNFCKNG